MCKYIQLNNFQKVPFVYTYTRFRSKIIHDSTAMYKSVKFFDKSVNRRDFLKLINWGSILQMKLVENKYLQASYCGNDVHEKIEISA